jgi:hypothetical protein
MHHHIGAWLLIVGGALVLLNDFSVTTYAMIPGLSTVDSVLPANLTLGDALMVAGTVTLLMKHGI